MVFVLRVKYFLTSLKGKIWCQFSWMNIRCWTIVNQRQLLRAILSKQIISLFTLLTMDLEDPLISFDDCNLRCEVDDSFISYMIFEAPSNPPITMTKLFNDVKELDFFDFVSDHDSLYPHPHIQPNLLSPSLHPVSRLSPSSCFQDLRESTDSGTSDSFRKTCLACASDRKGCSGFPGPCNRCSLKSRNCVFKPRKKPGPKSKLSAKCARRRKKSRKSNDKNWLFTCWRRRALRYRFATFLVEECHDSIRYLSINLSLRVRVEFHVIIRSI